MGWFAAQKAISPNYTTLQLNTATSILPVRIVWGTAKVGVNIIWYANLQLHETGSSGKGFLGSGSGQSYFYGADMILALCEGPIAGVGAIWQNNAQYTLGETGGYGSPTWSLFDGTQPQTTWPYLEDNYPTQAISYQATAYFGIVSAYLGSNAQLGNTTVEVQGVLAGTAVNGIDADPAQVIDDFLTNPTYGVGFDPASINASTLFGSGGDASLQTYCRAQGIGISPVLETAEQASSILTRWLQLLNCAAVWSGGELKFIPYGDQTIASGDITTTVQVTVPSPVPAPTPPTPFPTVKLSSPSAWVHRGAVTYAFTGEALTYAGLSPTGVGTYGIDPLGTYVFYAAGDGNDIGQVVNITFTYSNPSTYVPDLTPVYSLTDLDFVDEKGNKDPVQVSRVDPFSLATIQRIECLSRDNQYAGVPIEARDQSQIELYGPRVGSTIQAHEICDEVVIAPIVVQTILQRQLYVRAHFTFKLSWEYGLLDPMDIVEITDANLGLTNYPVRIDTIEEDDKGLLTITAEELTVGVSTPVYYPSSGLSPAFVPNQNIGVYPVTVPPLIYEPPTAASGGTPVVWVGASGGSAGVADPNWGGAYVWLSIDDVTYEQVATLTQPIVQGVLTAGLAAASGWDTTDTCAVNLTESDGDLDGTSIAYAQQGGTLSLVDGELFAYENATLTGTTAYNLTDLARGLYGTTGASHASGAGFYRIVVGQTVAAYDLPANYIGVTLYLKFQSFNIFGAGVEDLSSCSVYTYTPSGSGVTDPIAQQLLSGFPVNLGSVTATPATVFDNFGSVTGAVTQTINLGTTP
jgi:hypothetical protein